MARDNRSNGSVTSDVPSTTSGKGIHLTAADNNLMELVIETDDASADCDVADEYMSELDSPHRGRTETAQNFVASRSLPDVEDANTLWFELTETIDYTTADDRSYGLLIDALKQVEQQFGKDDKIPDTLKYELTEDLGPSDQNWGDNHFGFSDEQLEVLWKRFGTRMGCDSSTSEGPVSTEFGTPPSKTLETVAKEQDLPCTEALQTVEEFITDTTTLEQFLGQSVPDLPRVAMQVSMISTHNVNGTDWYLFKVTDTGTSRCYMKTFSDFEELHIQLEKASAGKVGGSGLPSLHSRDKWDLKRLWFARDSDKLQAERLQTYISELTSLRLTLLQEQVLRLFFGPMSRGQIFLPPGAS